MAETTLSCQKETVLIFALVTNLISSIIAFRVSPNARNFEIKSILWIQIGY